jgi:RNA polymerase sigma-70 factor, ECF subfamily
VLTLRDVEGLSAEEAARVVGIEVRALKSRLHRARLRLREHLAVLFEEEQQRGGPACPELAGDSAGGDAAQGTRARLDAHLERRERGSLR